MKNLIHSLTSRSGNSLVSLLILVAALAFLGFNSLYAVTEWEQAIVTQFGEIKGAPVTKAGLHFKVPFVQQVHLFDKRLLRWDGRETSTITQDRKTIIINITARWRIADARTFLETVGSADRAASRLTGIIEGAVKDEIAKYHLYEVVRSSNRILEADPAMTTLLVADGEELPTTDLDLARLGGNLPPLSQGQKGEYTAGRPVVIAGILREARARLQQVGLGIELEDLLIRQLNYSSAIEGNVYAQMNAELQKISAGFRSIGRQRAEEKLGEMGKELASIHSEAVEQSERVRGEAEAEAIKVYAEAYNLDPDFYQFLRSLQSYEQILGKNSTLILTTESPLFELFKK